MARANSRQTSPNSNGQKLASHSQMLNDTDPSDVTRSDSRDEGDIPAVRPKDHAAAAVDERQQEQQDDNEAKRMAGLLNVAGLSGTPKTQLEGLVANQTPKDRSMSTGANRQPDGHEIPTEPSSSRSNMHSGSTAASGSRLSRPKGAFEDMSKKPRQRRSERLETKFAVEVEVRDYTNDSEEVCQYSEDERDKQQNSSEIAEAGPVRITRSKTAAMESFATYQDATRSRSAKAAEPADVLKRSGQSNLRVSETSAERSKEPPPAVSSTPERKPRRGRPPKAKPSAELSDPTPMRATQQPPTSESGPSKKRRRAPSRDSNAANRGEEDGPRVANSEKDRNSKEEPLGFEDEEKTSSSWKAMLESLSVEIGRLGQKKRKDGSYGEMLDLDQEYETQIGKQISIAADYLIKHYTEVWETKLAEVVDLGRVDEIHQSAIKNMRKLEEKCHNMLWKRLGKRSDSAENAQDKCRTDMLKDIYIHVAPRLVDALKAAGRPHEPSKMATEDIQEFLMLLEILYAVAERTRLQGKDLQPTVHGIAYPLAGPTHKLLPILKQLRKKCQDELKSRRVEELRRTEPERRWKKKEREAEEAREAEEDFWGRFNECNRRIAAELEEKRNELGLPSFSQPEEMPSRVRPRWDFMDDEEGFQDDLEAEEARVAEKDLEPMSHEFNRKTGAQQERRKVLGLPPRIQPVEKPPSSQPSPMFLDDDEGFYDDHQAETVREVGLFGRNNLHPGTAPKEWSKFEIEILVEGLWRERGPTRYQKLAMRLDRTMDEIFERAKYLKAQVEYTLKRLQEENPYETYPPVKPWIENIGSERYYAP